MKNSANRVYSKSDRTILGDLVAASIDSYLADPSLHDPSFLPQEHLFPNWRRELSSYGNHIYGYPYIGLTTFLCYRKDLLALDDPVNQHAGLLFEVWDYLGLREGIQKPFLACQAHGESLALGESGPKYQQQNNCQDEPTHPARR